MRNQTKSKSLKESKTMKNVNESPTIYPIASDNLPLKELRKIEKKCKSMGLELEGNIYLIQSDKDGNVLLKDELNSSHCLQILSNCLEKKLEKFCKQLEKCGKK
jgi:hypothetical protein